MLEMQDMRDRVLKIVDESIAFFLSNRPDPELSQAIVAEEEEIDDLVVALREHHVERLSRMECSPETGMVYVDILTDLERVSDHATNIIVPT